MASPVIAALYDRLMAAAEQAGLADRRRRLLAGAHGRVVDLGAGTGVNLPYLRDVDELHLVEPDKAMARRLGRRLRDADMRAVVHQATVIDAPLPQGAFDTVVCTLVLCSVDDVAGTLARIRGLLAPGGRVLFLEHVRATGATARLQDVARPVWQRFAGGCRPNRDTLDALRAAGFAITDCDRFRILKVSPLVAAGVAGIAVPKVRSTAEPRQEVPV